MFGNNKIFFDPYADIPEVDEKAAWIPQQEKASTAPSGGFFGATRKDPYAEANQYATDADAAWKEVTRRGDLPMLGLMAGLSLMAHSAREGLGEAIGNAGMDTLGQYANTTSGRRNALERDQMLAMKKAQYEQAEQQRQLENNIALSNLLINRANYEQQAKKAAREQAGWDALSRAYSGKPLTGDGTASPQGDEKPVFSERPHASNPLNLKVPGGEGYRVFKSGEEAFRAYRDQLARYAARGAVTPRQMIGLWAPAADGNPTDQYVTNAGDWSGLDMDKPIDLNDLDAVSRLLSAMARQEMPDGKMYTPKVVLGFLTGNQSAEWRDQANPLAPGQVSDNVPRVGGNNPLLPPLLDPTTRANLERVANMGGAAGSAARQQLNADDSNRMKVAEFQQKQAKEDRELGEKEEKELKQQKNTMKYANIVTDDVRRAKKLAKDYWVVSNTGFGGAMLRAIPGTKASDLDKVLDSIKSNLSFERLQEMRNSSPTGGALGNVSDNENRMLQAALGSLAQVQSEKEFLYTLNRVETIYNNIVHGEGNWMRDDDGDIVVRKAPQKDNSRPSLASFGRGGK